MNSRNNSPEIRVLTLDLMIYVPIILFFALPFGYASLCNTGYAPLYFVVITTTLFLLHLYSLISTRKNSTITKNRPKYHAAINRFRKRNILGLAIVLSSPLLYLTFGQFDRFLFQNICVLLLIIVIERAVLKRENEIYYNGIIRFYQKEMIKHYHNAIVKRHRKLFFFRKQIFAFRTAKDQLM